MAHNYITTDKMDMALTESNITPADWNYSHIPKANTTMHDDHIVVASPHCGAEEMKHILLTIVAVLGILANTTSFMVLHWRYPQTSVNIYLKALALADCSFLLSTILITIVESNNQKYSPLALAVTKLIIRFVINELCQSVSVWLIVILSLSRYLAISRPLHMKHSCLNKRVKTSILLTVLVSMVAKAIHTGLMAQCEPDLSNSTSRGIDNNDTSTTVATNYNCYMDMYVPWRRWVTAAYYAGFMFIIPAIPLLFFNLRLLKHLINLQEQDLAEIPTLTHQLKCITKTVLAIVLVYLISYFPYCIYAILITVPATLSHLSKNVCQAEYVRAVIVIIYHLNSCVNFLIYVYFKESFYKNVILLLRQRGRKRFKCIDRNEESETDL